MAMNELQRAEQVLGILFGFRTDRAPDNTNVDLAVSHFKDYVQELRKSIYLKGKDA